MNMKAQLKVRLLLAGVSVATLFAFSAQGLRANDANQPQVVTCTGTGNVWNIRGAATNGISGEVRIVCEGQSRFLSVVFVMRQGSLLPLQGTNSPVYKASFCGPIELQDADGNNIPLLKPDVSSPELYPDSFNLTNHIKLMPKLEKGFILMLPPAPQSYDPDFLREPNRYYSIATFNLNSYFKPEKAGEYKLTVWPKIYRQSETNNDIYQRIDVPPIAVIIEWE